MISEGNIQRIIIENEKDEVLVEIPLAVAVVGAVIVPALAGVSAILLFFDMYVTQKTYWRLTKLDQKVTM